MADSLVQRSKFLSYVLRHAPDAVGIELSEAGWIDVDTLLEAAAKHGQSMSRTDLDEVVSTNSKQRFEFSADGRQIRARQGHSIEVDLQLAACEPPAVLYHGTATRFLDSIRRQGLVKGSRHHVHLSPDVETATEVGRRHGKQVVLVVNAAGLHAAGAEFFCTENNVWLTDAVPAEFLVETLA